jgi:regulation of enolase protein 1 (concanavalin A-like superfamily)
MRANRDVEPWRTAYSQFRSTSEAKLGYNMQGPFDKVARETNQYLNQYANDCKAVMYQAIEWYMTGNSVYAETAINIINKWSTKHIHWGGGTPFLAAGDYGGTMVAGAEILRYTYPNWTEEATINSENYFQTMLWPQFNIGDESIMRSANQGAGQLNYAFAVAIYCNNKQQVAQVLKAWHENECAGLSGTTLASGQNADTGRDQGHALGHIVNLVSMAEMAWKQNIDLYGDLDNRLLATMEYFSSYNLGNDVPFVAFGACYGLYITMGAHGRGLWSWSHGVLETIRGHYVIRKGLPAPYTLKYLEVVGVSIATFLTRKDSFKSANLTGIDIGNTGLVGSTTYTDGIWNLTGAGIDIHRGDNSVHFAYQPLKGNGALIARLLSMSSTHEWTKAGIMVRQTLQPDSPYAAVHMKPNTEGVTFFNRGIRGGTTGNVQNHVPEIHFPYWLKMERNGNLITGYNSYDGQTWTPMRVVSMPADDVVYIGLLVTSLSTTEYNTALFDYVSFIKY